MSGRSEKEQKTMQRAVLAVVCITNFINPFASTALNIAIPHIGKEFSASVITLPWIVLSFVLVTALLSIPLGRLADIYGRELMLKLGILIVCISSLLNVFSPDMTIFILCRVFQGIGAAMIFATNVAILVDAYPSEKRGSVLGISTAVVYLGAAAGPFLGGFITHIFGWHGIFVLISALALISFITAIIKLPKDAKKEPAQKVNFVSILLFMISLGLVMYGFSTFAQNIHSYIILAAGIVLGVVFIRHESRTEMPVIKIQLFKNNRKFSLSILAALFNFASIIAISYLLSLYLQLVKGFSADVSGAIMIIQPVVQTILSPIMGRLSDRKAPDVIASIGMAICSAALIMFIFLDTDTSLFYIFIGLLLTGIGVALFSSPNANVVMGSVSREDYSIAASVQSTARTVGQAIGIALITIIMNAVIGNMPIEDVAPALIVQDMQISFFVFAIICIIGVFISLQRRPSKLD